MPVTKAQARDTPAPAPARDGVAAFILVPLGGCAFGLAAIALGEQGTGSRPLLAGVVIAAAAAAGLAPLRFGLPAAIVLASFGAFFGDFVGAGAEYANEAYVLALALTSAVRRRPTRNEAAVTVAIAAVYLGYLAAGNGASEVYWAAKVLFTSVIAGWAIFRVRPGQRDWRAAFLGLAFATAANVVVALWQLEKGVAGLQDLGVPYAERIRQTADQSLRAFGGMSSPAPFSYLLAIAVLWWLATAAGEREDRRVALLTAWLPPLAIVGIVLSDDRLAFVGLGVALASLAGRRLQAQHALAAAAVVPVVVALVVVSSPGSRLAARAVKYESASAEARRALWTEYSRRLSAGGAGPGAAGAAYERVAEPRSQEPGLRALRGWLPIQHPHPQVPLQTMRERSSMLVGRGLTKARPLRWQSLVRSLDGGRALVARVDGQVVGRWRLSPESWRRVAFQIQSRRGGSVLALTASADRPGLAAQFIFIDVAGLEKEPLTAAERIYRRAFVRVASTQNTEPASAGPGVVDNMYLSWLFQYGLFVGAFLSIAFAVAMLSPLAQALKRRPAEIAAALTGVFVLVAGLAVNVWEEAPTDFVAAVALALGFARMPVPRPRQRPR